jgi:acyl carrier protein
VNWDGWGLREEGKQEAGIGATLSKLAMSPKQGVEAFRRVLSMAEVPQVVVSTGDLQTRIDQWLKLESLRDTEYSKKKDSLSLHSRSNLRNAYVAPRNEVEQTIANIWQQILGIEQVGIHDDFFELGGDSLIAVQVISRLRKECQIELPLHSFFERPTNVAGLAERVEAIRLTLTQASASPIAAGEGRKEIVL